MRASWSRRRRPRSTSTPTSARGGTTCNPGTASAPAWAWPGFCCQRYGVVTLPGTVFGDRPGNLTLRLATSRIYGNSADQQEKALEAADPLRHAPYGALARLAEILADLTG